MSDNLPGTLKQQRQNARPVRIVEIRLTMSNVFELMLYATIAMIPLSLVWTVIGVFLAAFLQM